MAHPNSRAERRALARKHDGRHGPPTCRGFEQKKWKLIFRRANKLHRALQTGRIWPYREWEMLMADAEPLRLLPLLLPSPWTPKTFQSATIYAPSVSLACDLTVQDVPY